MSNYEKKGYLHENFKLFYLTDNSSEEPDYHYHDFNKIIIFIKGRISYMIEGRSYDLQPHDIVLVNQNHIHKPFIDNSVPYERIIIYISPDFLETYHTETYDLSYCFQRAKKEASYVVRIPNRKNNALLESTLRLEQAIHDHDYAHELMQQLEVLQFFIHLNRASLIEDITYVPTSIQNRKIIEIMDYINDNLASPLSIDNISEHFYISKYYMMRNFKSDTGYTILDYITMKRMILAQKFIREKYPLTQVAYECGYNDYSTFYRAYKKFYSKTPKEV